MWEFLAGLAAKVGLREWRERQSKWIDLSDDAADVLKRMREDKNGGYFVDTSGLSCVDLRLTCLSSDDIEFVTTPGIMVELMENDLVTCSINSQSKKRYQLTQRGKTVGFKRKHQR